MGEKAQNVGNQIIEEFWGVELSGSKKESKWLDENDDSDSLYTDKALELRQACLGASAKEGERNVVEMTTDNDEGESVTHTILSMKVGAVEQSTLFLTLRPPVTLKLVKGSGPIHIVGQMNETLDIDALLSSDDDESDDEELVTEVGSKTLMSRKRPAASLSTNPSKMTKLSGVDSAVSNGKRKKPTDIGSEGSSEEEEEEEEEDDSEEENEEEESEEEEIPSPVKQQDNKKRTKIGKKDNKKHVVFKTPQPQKPNGRPQKGTVSAPTTPKSAKKSFGKETPTVNEIKERLTKMNVPKKLEKFNNFVSNSFKIKDDSIKKQLWEYVQKKRPQE